MRLTRDWRRLILFRIDVLDLYALWEFHIHFLGKIHGESAARHQPAICVDQPPSLSHFNIFYWVLIAALNWILAEMTHTSLKGPENAIKGDA